MAGGLQQAAMQVGGSLGTAALGAIMAARVDDLLPGRWADAGLPPGTPQQMAQASDAVSVGLAPVPPGTPPELAAKITDIARDTFVSGMSTAFAVAGVISVFAAGVAFFTKRGENAEAARAHPTSDRV
ncbi:hypothetical protein ACFQ2B_22500 [Streptomyces stramineus]